MYENLKKINTGEIIRNWHLKANLNDVLQVNKTSFMSIIYRAKPCMLYLVQFNGPIEVCIQI